jgi:hypothetical protein
MHGGNLPQVAASPIDVEHIVPLSWCVTAAIDRQVSTLASRWHQRAGMAVCVHPVAPPADSLWQN